jgi:hypothetical protein
MASENELDRLRRFAVPAAIWFGVGLRVVVFAAMAIQLSGDANPTGYVERFSEIARADGRPYRDFAVEYPPVTLGAIELVGDEDVATTALSTLVLAALLDAGLALALAWGWGASAAAAYLAGSLLLLGMIYTTLDILPASLAVLGLAMALRGRQRSGGIVMAAAMLAKLWPVVLVPGLWVWGRRRALSWAVVAVAAGALAWVAWGGPGALEQVATQRDSPGWEAESTVGAVVRLVGGEQVRIIKDSPRVGVAPAWAKGLLAAATVLGVAAVWRRASGGAVRGEVGAPTLAAVAVLLFFSSIYSYPYVLWLLPWAAIAWAERRTLLASMALAVGIVTAALYVLLGGGVLREAAVVVYLIVLFRDGLTGAIAVVYLVGREPVSSRAVEPVPTAP